MKCKVNDSIGRLNDQQKPQSETLVVGKEAGSLQEGREDL
jgi:hypothetical protein